MLSQRRMRLIIIGVVALLFLTFYYSGETSKIQNQKFYRSTLDAMKAKEAAKHAKTQEKIQNAMHPPGQDDPAVKVPNTDAEKPAIPPATGNEDVEEIPIAGRTKMTVPKKANTDTDTDAQAGIDSGSNVKTEEEEKEERERADKAKKEQEAKTELNAILKRAPVIIFSKSYCPYSKRAKTILLDHYFIQPQPFVVELDQHPLGPYLQALLAQNTGRRTVPNVIVTGQSIGGGDDIAELDQRDELASKLRQLGGKWIVDVTHKVDESL
ncbi:hypothetical protein PENANT_c012G09995 [Penicillium antarcticum]|uniref:Glutaredoxin domain-containing protein n=1 Tax=Penicillium antarcticum TaxID=416450 RepID=A0A1V6Q5P3_9EURO|nr:uncharacterized protein N7508_008208 [Penicillium antarcticum]KAJ5297959.1 hypothetical protein N7508_008208 [Penicillium antarcticum]OQD84558.1 hypothetical protein PENANT_c012G09995 [Penicillium antarcticum]